MQAFRREAAGGEGRRQPLGAAVWIQTTLEAAAQAAPAEYGEAGERPRRNRL